MPRRLHIALFSTLVVIGLALVTPPQLTPRSASAANCAPPPPNAAPSKLQIVVHGPRSLETSWAFFISPNPYTFSGTMRVADNDTADLNRTAADILLEGVCTTLAAEPYTVSVDPSITPVCPLIQTALTRSGPQPTAPGADPDTAAFYFMTLCPTPTPLPTPTATPAPANLIVNLNPPTILSLSAGSVSTGSVSTGNASAGSLSTGASANGSCPSSALVSVLARQGGGPVPDGTPVQLSTTLGVLASTSGTTVGGAYTTQLSAPSGTSNGSGFVTAQVMGSSASAPFTVTSCSPLPPAAPISQTLSEIQIKPPNTGDAGLQ